jgi:alanine racemase
LSNCGIATVEGFAAPVIGRVSMDMIAVDVTKVPVAEPREVALLHAQYTVNDLAQAMGTIGYEVLTRIGNRVKRVYR